MNLVEIFGEELAEKVKEKLGDKYKIIEEKDWVPKHRFNEAIQQRDEYKNMLDERNKQLEELKEKAKGNEDLLEKINELEKQNKETEQKYQKKLETIQKQTLVEKELMKKKAKYPELLMSKIDLEKLELEDGKVKGLDEVVTDLKENYKDLFEDTSKAGSEFNQNNKKIPETNPWKQGQVNLSEQYRLIQQEPELAKKLIQEAGLDPKLYF